MKGAGSYEVTDMPTHKEGYIALIMVLTVTAFVLAITITISLLSIGEGQGSLALYKGEDTLQFVDGCTEDALLKARASDAYNGGNITRPEGTCTVNVAKAGTNWTITVSTTNTSYIRTIEVQINRNPTGVTLTSWREKI